MLKEEKLNYQEELERYVEDNDVYDVFETMMKHLIMKQPSDPIPFLLDVLQNPQTKRIFIMGPPGSKRKEHILTLADNFEDFKYEAISVGDLLNKEISKKSEMGKRIVESRKTYLSSRSNSPTRTESYTHSYVDDDIVIELVSKAIHQYEKEQKSWIIEGYPRTREQALSLTKMDFIPDRMILLEVDDKITKERIVEDLSKEEKPKVTNDPSEIADFIIEEYKTHIEGVKDIYNGRIAVIDGNKRQDIVLQEIARILKLKQANAPRTCPKIVLIGSPGSGKTTQARMIAEKLKVVHINVNSMIKDYIALGKEDSSHVWKLMKEGESIPEEIYETLLKDRLSQLDA